MRNYVGEKALRDLMSSLKVKTIQETKIRNNLHNMDPRTGTQHEHCGMHSLQNVTHNDSDMFVCIEHHYKLFKLAIKIYIFKIIHKHS